MNKALSFFFKITLGIVFVLNPYAIYTQILQVATEKLYLAKGNYLEQNNLSQHYALYPISVLEEESIFVDSLKMAAPSKDTNPLKQHLFSLQAFPLADFTLDKSASGKVIGHTSLGYGIQLAYRFKKRVSVFASYQDHYMEPNSWTTPFINRQEIVPEGNRAHILGNWVQNKVLSSSVNLRLTNWYALDLGVGKHFIGRGYRSLLLSDAGSPYPYLRNNFKMGKINYSNMLSSLREVQYGNGVTTNLPKYAIMHMVDAPLGKHVQIGFFESVVWGGKDTLINRGIDPAYLNPFVFYRPEEYAGGSSDNVLMGAFSSLHFGKFEWYGQLSLDEFLLKEWRDNRGWWANKYGFQTGIKLKTLIKNTVLLLEYNQASPFTYAHARSMENYGHKGQVLTHPMGSNFREILGIIMLAPTEKWNIQLSAVLAQKGLDYTDSISEGGNIFKPYGLRKADYGYKLLNGKVVNYYSGEVRLSYLISVKTNLMAQIAFQISALDDREDTSKPVFQPFFRIGLQAPLWNQYRDYIPTL